MVISRRRMRRIEVAGSSAQVLEIAKNTHSSSNGHIATARRTICPRRSHMMGTHRPNRMSVTRLPVVSASSATPVGRVTCSSTGTPSRVQTMAGKATSTDHICRALRVGRTTACGTGADCLRRTSIGWPTAINFPLTALQECPNCVPKVSFYCNLFCHQSGALYPTVLH